MPSRLNATVSRTNSRAAQTKGGPLWYAVLIIMALASVALPLLLFGCVDVQCGGASGESGPIDPAIMGALQGHNQQIQNLAKQLQAMQRASAKPAPPPGEGFREALKQQEAKPGEPEKPKAPATPGPESKK